MLKKPDLNRSPAFSFCTASLVLCFIASVLFSGCSGKEDADFKAAVTFLKEHSQESAVKRMTAQSLEESLRPSDWMKEVLSANFQASHIPLKPFNASFLAWSFYENRKNKDVYVPGNKFLVVIPVNDEGTIYVRGYTGWEGPLVFEKSWSFPDLSGSQKRAGIIKPESPKYSVYAANIEYEVSMGPTGGLLDIRLQGVAELYFDRWGEREALYLQTRENTAGFESRQNILKLEIGKKRMNIDFLNRTGSEEDFIPVSAYSPEQMAEDGAHKKGAMEIAGKVCDLWEQNGEDVCIWEGIPLLETSVLFGKRLLLKATHVDPQPAVAEYHFSKPDNVRWS